MLIMFLFGSRGSFFLYHGNVEDSAVDAVVTHQESSAARSLQMRKPRNIFTVAVAVAPFIDDCKLRTMGHGSKKHQKTCVVIHKIRHMRLFSNV